MTMKAGAGDQVMGLATLGFGLRADSAVSFGAVILKVDRGAYLAVKPRSYLHFKTLARR
jgi:hypothetical protein